MKRSEFIRQLGVLGVGAPFLSMLLQSCDREDLFEEFDVNYTGKVIVVGAGAAGLTAGYLLKRYGIDFEILEASSVVGGRVKRMDGLADFPIDLGAEWIHEDPAILAELISNSGITDTVDIIKYSPETMYSWNNGQLNANNWASNFYSEHKFKSTTWYGFFEKHFLPDVADHLQLNTPVSLVDYSSDEIQLEDQSGNTHVAGKVILTVPTKVLQSGVVNFSPALPIEKQNAIDGIEMPGGLKVFIRFAERFYPDMLVMGPFLSALNEDSRLYYDAAFRKDSNSHVLGLFSVGQPSDVYTTLPNDDAIFEKVMSELDEMFGGEATKHYIDHAVQNWSAEPFIQGSYTGTVQGNYNSTIEDMARSVSGKLYFAGEATSVDRTATVPGAAVSAYDAVRELLKG